VYGEMYTDLRDVVSWLMFGGRGWRWRSTDLST
jgi:hypothetical protein